MTVVSVPAVTCDSDSSSTYSSIKTAVADWLARGDLTSRIADFVEYGQHRIYRRLRHRKMERTYIATLDANNRADIPCDFIQVKNFFLFNYSGILPGTGLESLALDDESITDLQPLYVESEQNVYDGYSGSRLSTIPRVKFKLIRQGTQFLVKPSYTDLPYVGGFYYAKPALLSDSNTTNFLTRDAPDLLIAASCYEGSVYVKDTEGAAYWKQQLDERLTELGNEASAMEQAGSTLAPTLSYAGMA